MTGKKGKLENISAQHMDPKTERTSIWIRPRKFPIEIGMSGSESLSPPRKVEWKNVLRFLVDLLGVIILLISCWLILTQTVQNINQLLNLQGSPESRMCSNLQRCGLNAVTSTPSNSNWNQFLATGIPSAPTPTPSQGTNSNAMSSPTLSSTPIPSVPVLSVPTSLSLSYALECAAGKPDLLKLSNTGGSVLIWLEDKKHTSRQLSISDPTKSYLIQPGKNATAYVKCSRAISEGEYNLRILYNGGSTSITIKITA